MAVVLENPQSFSTVHSLSRHRYLTRQVHNQRVASAEAAEAGLHAAEAQHEAAQFAIKPLSPRWSGLTQSWLISGSSRRATAGFNIRSTGPVPPKPVDPAHHEHVAGTPARLLAGNATASSHGLHVAGNARRSRAPGSPSSACRLGSTLISRCNATIGGPVWKPQARWRPEHN
jgi:hypothetical protein